MADINPAERFRMKTSIYIIPHAKKNMLKRSAWMGTLIFLKLNSKKENINNPLAEFIVNFNASEA
ncbi:hypothetical protein [Pseudomonas pseudonitroreducens]|uniref:hypothetical protein n=1 Tax=Pseudomonas pseudonitroreducens TaxID=2892326 RepID=UPI001F3A8958|nr:hypothetical protein [Pseudomonas pseudonitroreducens]